MESGSWLLVYQYPIALMPAVIFILFGLMLFVAKVPSKPNWWAGYRTPRACKNTDVWRFANSLFGKCILIAGIIVLIGSLVALFLLGGSDEAVAVIGVNIITLVGLAMIIIPIVITETALNKNFDKEGNRKV